MSKDKIIIFGLSECAFEYNDKYYPLIVYAVVKKNG